MTDPVFLFGSFTEDEASSYQSSTLESSRGRKIPPPEKPVKQNGFRAVPPAAAPVVKQNGHSAPSKVVNNSNGRVIVNGKAADNAVDALGKPLGQVPKKQLARPGAAVPVGRVQAAGRPSGGGVNNSVKYVASVTPKASAPTQNGGVQITAKPSGGPPVNSSVDQSAAPTTKVVVPATDDGRQNSVKASGGADTSENHTAAPTNSTVPPENGDQADWFVINTNDVSVAKDGIDAGEESPCKTGTDNASEGGVVEPAPLVVVAAVPAVEVVLEKSGSGSAADDDSEAVPSKLLPKTWAALVGVPGEFKAVPKPSAGARGKGRGSAAQSGANKAQPVVEVVVPVTALSGEVWLKSLREAEGSCRRLQPRGLINTGNSCFLNSTVQAMLSCSAFTHLLQVLKARSVPQDLNEESNGRLMQHFDCSPVVNKDGQWFLPTQTGYPTLQAFLDFSAEFESAPVRNLTKPRRDGDGKPPPVADVGRPFAPAMFDTILQSFTPDQPPRGTGRNRQEDAQEFLSFVIDRMHEEILRLQGKDSPSVQSVSSVTSYEDDDWEMVGPKNRSAVTRTHAFSESAITDIFGGQLRSVVKTKGNKASATVQPFSVLHLDIVPEVVNSVEDALRFFAAPESLEGYKPSTAKVGEVVSASKSVKIQTLPRVLILHLMRFSYGSGGSSKLHKPVQFPLELTLGRELLASTTTSGHEVRKYELVATLSHHGKDPSVGHYTADSKQASGQWLHFDDGVVSGVAVSRVLQEQAYVLFYRRAGF